MSVEVKLELGHRAAMRDKVTEQGFTHDWTVFVRGAEGNSIDCFVEKVVFHLHESFPKPKRVIKEPPYSVSESGYAGFMMPIDVYFRTKEEPKKVTFKYDLYLRLEALPVSNIRIEKLTFQNPSDDFRNKLVKAGQLSGAVTGPATGGSALLSTQACAPPPPQNTDEHQPNPPKPSVVEKKPKSHVPSKEIKSNQPPPPKPSHPFTDIFGAPIRTKNSPDSSSVKSKDSGHSSQTKIKSTSSSSSSSSSGKEGKPSSKESHKSKDSHRYNKESRHSNKEVYHLSKDSQSSRDTHHLSKEIVPEKDSHHLPKDSHSSKESHHSIKETLHKVKEHHSKEGHKKDNHHSTKEGKSSKESRPSKDHSLKDSKASKSGKSEKELNKSGVKRPAPTDSHSSHGNSEKKKKTSPVPSENSDKSSSHSKHKTKEGKEKAEKQKIKSLGNSIKKEEEKPKHKGSPVAPELVETKEMPKPKPNSPKPPSPILKPPSPIYKPPSPIYKPPSPIYKPPSPSYKVPSPDSYSVHSGSDESHKSINKAHYSSPASSISESSLHGTKPLDFMNMTYPSVISPLSDEDPLDDFSPPSKRKALSPISDMDDSSQESKSLKNRSMPKLNKKTHAHHKPPRPKSENFHQGNGSIHSDISMHHSPSPEIQNNAINNSAYREELLELQRIIMSSNDGKLLQRIVNVIEKTGKFEVTSTTIDFDLCTLDYAIIQEIKHCLEKNCDNCF